MGWCSSNGLACKDWMSSDPLRPELAGDIFARAAGSQGMVLDTLVSLDDQVWLHIFQHPKASPLAFS